MKKPPPITIASHVLLIAALELAVIVASGILDARLDRTAASAAPSPLVSK